MNVFLLGTGRCGTTTFIKACEHISNYTCGHESKRGMIASARFPYPLNHIEADNRLTWLLGYLERIYGESAIYIHLCRDRESTAQSFVKRMNSGIMKAYNRGILQNAGNLYRDIDICLDYIDSVNLTIEEFIKEKPHKMVFHLENSHSDFQEFWHLIGAKGNLEKGLSEFSRKHNSSDESNYLECKFVAPIARVAARIRQKFFV